MSFADFLGQEHIIRYIKKSVETGTLNHALLFSGPEGTGKATLALLLAQAVNCSGEGEAPCRSCLACRKTKSLHHPNVRVISRDGAHIKIHQVRSVTRDVALMPYEGRTKVYIFNDAEDMTVPAANSLLKVLEDPPPYALFLLLSSRPRLLLPTILSRCQPLIFRPVSEEAIASFLMRNRDDLLPGEARTFASLAQGSPGRALKLLEDRECAELRKMAANFLPQIMDQQRGEIFSLAEELAARNNLEFYLDLTLLFLRDILLYRRQGASNILYFSDYITSLKKMESIPERALLKAVRSVLSARKQLAAPVNSRLVLGVMLLELKEVIC